MLKEKICAVIACLILGTVSVTMCFPVIIDLFSGEAEEETFVWYDGRYDYPFSEETTEESEQEENTQTSFNWFEDIRRLVKSGTKNNYPYRMSFVLARKFWDKFTGLDMTTSLSTSYSAESVVSLGEDRLSYVLQEEKKREIEELIEIGTKVEAEGRQFMLFVTPFKMDETSETQSGIYENHSDAIEKAYINAIREAGFSVLSASEAIKEENIDRKSLFFKTDHHWLPQAALWGNRLLADYLNEHMGFSIDTSIFREENYDISYAKNEWFGSQGKKVTEVFCKPEPFPIVLPKYDTELTVFISMYNETVTGTVEETLLDWSIFENPDIYTRNNYAFYAYGDIALLSIHNHKVSDGKRILMIKHSFADAMIPSFAASVENLDVIDLRHFKGSLDAYIKETNPDTVVVVYGVG